MLLRDYIRHVQQAERDYQQCYTQTSPEGAPMDKLKIAELLDKRQSLKEIEEAAVAKRRAVDQQIVDMIRPEQTEGSTTVQLDDCKVSVTRAYQYKIDTSKLVNDFEGLDESVQSLFRWKPELNLADYREAAEFDRRVAEEYITVKPSAPTIRIV